MKLSKSSQGEKRDIKCYLTDNETLSVSSIVRIIHKLKKKEIILQNLEEDFTIDYKTFVNLDNYKEHVITREKYNIKIDYCNLLFYTRKIIVKLLIDFSPSLFRYDAISKRIFIQNLEESIKFLFDSFSDSLNEDKQYKKKIYISIYYFGTCSDQPQIMIDNFLFNQENKDELYNYFINELKILYEFLLEKIPKKDKNLNKGKKEAKENQDNEMKVKHLTKWTGIDFAIKSLIEKFKTRKLAFTTNKLIVLTDGIGLHSISDKQSLYLDKSKNFGLSTIFFLLGSKQISYLNEYGFIVNYKNIKRLAKKLNGFCINYEQIRIKENENNQKKIKKIRKDLLPYKIEIDFKKLNYDISIIDSNMMGSPQTKILETTKRKKELFVYTEYSFRSVDCFDDICKMRLIEGWSFDLRKISENNVCFSYQFNNHIKIRYSIKQDKSNDSKSHCEVQIYTQMNTMYLNFIKENKFSLNIISNLDNILKNIIQTDNLVSSLDLTFYYNCNELTNTFDLKNGFASKLNENSTITQWEKFFRVKNICYLFITNKISNSKQINYVHLFEEMINRNCDVRISQTLFLKNLGEKPFHSNSNSTFFLKKYFLLKLIWSSKYFLELKFAFRNTNYHEEKTIIKEFKKYINFHSIKDLNLINATNQILKFFVFDKKNNIIEKKEKEGVCFSKKWEWTSEKIQSIEKFYKLLVKEKRKSAEYFHLRNGDNINDNIFIKILNFKLNPTHTKTVKNIFIYKITLNDHSIEIEIKMSLKRFLSAYYIKSDDEENLIKQTAEKFIFEKCVSIYNEELLKAKHVYSTHILHMRTIQWKLNQSKFFEKNYLIYIENFKKSLKCLDYVDKFSTIPSPSQSVNINTSIDKFKRCLTLILKTDYQNFQKEITGEDYIKFSLILNNSYFLKSTRINIVEFIDNPDLCLKEKRIKLISETMLDLRKNLESLFDYTLQSRESQDRIKILNKGEFNCFSFLISYQYLLITALPIIDPLIILEKKIKTINLDHYIVDLTFIENNSDVYEKLDENKYTKNEEILSLILKNIEDQLKKNYYRSVFQSCLRDLQISSFDIIESASICSVNAITLNLSETFKIIQELIPNSFSSNHYLGIKKEKNNDNKKKKIKKNDGKDNLEQKINNFSSPMTPLLKQLRSSVWGQLNSIENLKIPYQDFINRNFIRIIEFYFKRIDNSKFYTPHLNSYETVIEKIRKSDDHFSMEYLNSLTKKLLFVAKDELQFLSLKVEYLSQNGDSYVEDFQSFVQAIYGNRITHLNTESSTFKSSLRLEYYCFFDEIKDKNLATTNDIDDKKLIPCKILDLKNLIEALIAQTNLELMRYKYLSTFHEIEKIRNYLSNLTQFQKGILQYKVNLVKENCNSYFLEELENEKSKEELCLNKLDKYFYLIYLPDKNSFLNDLEDVKIIESYETSADSLIIPFWFLIQCTSKEKEITIDLIMHLPYYRATMILNNESIIKKTINFLENVSYRANTNILIQDLKETLTCPKNLTLKHKEKKEKEKEIQQKEPPPSSKADNNKIRSSKKTGFKAQSNTLEKKQEIIQPEITKCYEIPLVYRKYFTMLGNLGLKSLLNYFSFNNFRVQNESGMYVGLYSKEIYILYFEEKSKQEILDSEIYKHYEKFDLEIMSCDNMKKIIILNIYGMNRMNMEALDYFTKHIITAKINEDIKVICSSLIKNDKVKLSKDYFDFLKDTQLRKIYKFYIPDFIKNIPAFMGYLKQTLLKIFYHFTLAQNFNYKINENSDNNSERLSKSSSSSDFFTIDPCEHYLLYNYLREINQEKKKLLEEIFGLCMFLLFISTEKYNGANYKYCNKFENLQVFESYEAKPQDSRASDMRSLGESSGKLSMETKQIENRLFYNYKELSLNSNCENQPNLDLEKGKSLFKKPIVINVNDEENDEIANPRKSSFHKLNNEKNDYLLLMEARIKGTLNEDKLIIYLTEILNQVGSEYMIEKFFQYFILVNKEEDEEKNDKTLMEFINFIDKIGKINKYYSFTLHNFNYSHSFLINNLIDLCSEIKKILSFEISKKINHKSKELIENNLPFTYLIHTKNKDNYLNYDYFLSKNFEEIKKVFIEKYVNNPENVINFSPKIIIFFCSYCFTKYFNFEKGNEFWTEADIFKFKNFDSFELFNSSSPDLHYKNPRNFYFKASISIGNINIKTYNINSEILSCFNEQLLKVENWSLQRFSIYKHVLLQKLGISNYKSSFKKKNPKKISNLFINSLNILQSSTPKIIERHKNKYENSCKNSDNIVTIEINEKEYKPNVTKIMLSRINNIFPKDDYISNEKFNEYFIKFSNASYNIIKPKKNSLTDQTIPTTEEILIDDYHKICLEFIKKAKDFYIKALLKKQLKILVEYNFNDNTVSEQLKQKIIKNFIKKSMLLHSEKIPFYLFVFLDKISSKKFEIIEEKDEKQVILGPMADKISKEEKLERKRAEGEKKQSNEFIYSVIENCLKLCEANNYQKFESNCNYEKIGKRIKTIASRLDDSFIIHETSSLKKCKEISGLLNPNSKYFDDKSNVFSSSDNNVTLISNYTLKKVLNNILFVLKITFDQNEFVLNIYYKPLETSKKSNNLSSTLDIEKNNLFQNYNLIHIIYDFQLELAFKIFIDNMEFSIDLNYIHFLAYLYNLYQNEKFQNFILKSIIFKFKTNIIEPKTTEELIDCLKEYAITYGFFCRNLKYHKSLIMFPPQDQFNFNKYGLKINDILILFDFLESEQEKQLNNIEKIDLFEEEENLNNADNQYVYLTFSIIVKKKEKDNFENKYFEFISEFQIFLKQFIHEKIEKIIKNLLLSFHYWNKLIDYKNDSTFDLNDLIQLKKNCDYYTIEKSEAEFESEIFNFKIFDTSFVKYLHTRFLNLKIAYDEKDEGKITIFIAKIESNECFCGISILIHDNMIKNIDILKITEILRPNFYSQLNENIFNVIFQWMLNYNI